MIKLNSFLQKTKEQILIRYESIKKFLADEFSKTKEIQYKVEKKELDYVSDAKEALISERNPFKILLYSIAALVLIAVIWAKFAIVDQVTVGAGKVIPSSHVQIIQSLDGGILYELLVKEGQIVKPNQIVARLRVNDFMAEFLSTKNHYNALLAGQARLEAEANDKNTIEFPKKISDQTELTQNEMKLFESRKKELAQRLLTLNESYKILEKQLNITQPLASKGIVSKLDLLQLQGKLTEVKGAIESEQDKFHKDVLTDLSKTQDELKSLNEKMLGLQDRISRSTIRSPVYGVVKQINVTTIGGVIQPGGALMQIVPLDDTLLIETKILPKDIGFIHPGEKATVKFTAYDYSIYGGLDGKVEYISPDTVVDDKGETFYVIQVRTNRNYIGDTQKPLPIIPGMIATVDIVTGKQSIASYILKPILKAKYEALREH